MPVIKSTRNYLKLSWKSTTYVGWQCLTVGSAPHRVQGSAPPLSALSDVSDEGVADCTRGACAPQKLWLMVERGHYNPCPLTTIYSPMSKNKRLSALTTLPRLDGNTSVKIQSFCVRTRSHAKRWRALSVKKCRFFCFEPHTILVSHHQGHDAVGETPKAAGEDARAPSRSCE